MAYYHHDHLDTPIQATDKQGNVVWSAQYNVFGGATITTPATPDKPTISSDLRLPGQVEDEETGLHYNWHRYYEPGLGRYVTADPIGLKGGLNTYAYVLNNPLRWIDPWGLEPYTVYPDSKSAGEQAIRDINPTSIRDGVEYAGRVCSYSYIMNSDDSGCFYTPPNKGGKDWSYDGVCPYGTSPKGNYHTHGSYDPKYFNERFSPEDKANLDKDNQTGYLGTPKGVIKSYTPDLNIPLGGQVQVIGNGAK